MNVNTFLREVTDSAVFRFADFTTIGLESATDTFHQRGLACAVVSGKGDTLLRHDGEGEVFEDDAGAKFDA